jgi:plasmid stability protein
VCGHGVRMPADRQIKAGEFLRWVSASHGRVVRDECRRILANDPKGKLAPLEVLSQALDTVYRKDLEQAAAAAALPFDDSQ